MRDAWSSSRWICAETRLLRLVDAFRAERLGELVVRSPLLTGFSTSFTVTANTASLPASSATGYSAGKMRLHVAALALLRALEAFLEAGNEVRVADHELQVLTRAALELRRRRSCP